MRATPVPTSTTAVSRVASGSTGFGFTPLTLASVNGAVVTILVAAPAAVDIAHTRALSATARPPLPLMPSPLLLPLSTAFSPSREMPRLMPEVAICLNCGALTDVNCSYHCCHRRCYQYRQQGCAFSSSTPESPPSMPQRARRGVTCYLHLRLNLCCPARRAIAKRRRDGWVSTTRVQ